MTTSADLDLIPAGPRRHDYHLTCSKLNSPHQSNRFWKAANPRSLPLLTLSLFFLLVTLYFEIQDQSSRSHIEEVTFKNKSVQRFLMFARGWPGIREKFHTHKKKRWFRIRFKIFKKNITKSASWIIIYLSWNVFAKSIKHTHKHTLSQPTWRRLLLLSTTQAAHHFYYMATMLENTGSATFWKRWTLSPRVGKRGFCSFCSPRS